MSRLLLPVGTLEDNSAAPAVRVGGGVGCRPLGAEFEIYATASPATRKPDHVTRPPGFRTREVCDRPAKSLRESQ